MSQWLESITFLGGLANKGLFTPTKSTMDNRQPVNKYIVSQAISKNDKKIFVFDGLFDKDVLDNLRSNILNYGVFYYDDSYDEDSDNVQWIAGFEVDHFVKSNLWETVQNVSCNTVKYTAAKVKYCKIM